MNLRVENYCRYCRKRINRRGGHGWVHDATGTIDCPQPELKEAAA